VDIYNHLVEHVYSKHKVPDGVMTLLLEEHREDIEARTPKWTPEEAEAMLENLRLYYKEPVMPIGKYCEAFRTWQDAIEDAAEQAKEDPDESPFARQSLEDMARAIQEVSTLVSKSNLLSRLLYGGEELRTERCPIHKGHWSGCVWGDGRCPHCMSGDNVTGWVRPALKESV
jgi:hypothetical protein